MDNQNSISPASTESSIQFKKEDDKEVIKYGPSAFALFAWQSDLGAGDDQYSPNNALELFQDLQVINNLPSENKSLMKIDDNCHQVYLEELKLIKKLRDMADHLAKIHGGVLIADRVGTGVGIGGSVLAIGGLLAAPFTAGLSLGLTVGGIGAGILGGGTSIGSNITGHIMLQRNLKELATDAESHYLIREELIKLVGKSELLKHASRLRPSLEMLINLSESSCLQLFTKIKKMIQLALDGAYDMMKNLFENSQDTKILKFLKIFLGERDSKLLRALADVVDQILAQIRSFKSAIKAAINLINKPELVNKAMHLCSMNVGARAATVATSEAAAAAAAAFKGTALGMSKSARYTAAAFTAAFIVVDVIHMVKICRETGETPTVQKLRSLADDLESTLHNQAEQTI